MAEIWGAVAVAGAAIYTGASGASAARSAGNAAARGADAATAEGARQYDQTRADLAPYRTTGTGALNQLARVFGLPTESSEQFQARQPIVFGDTALPANAVASNPSDPRGSDITLNGQLIGHVYPGGPNGRFRAQPGTDINALLRESSAPTGSAAPTAGGTPDMSGFFTSPGYQFRRDEGMRGIERTAAARGGAFSGNALRALSDFNSNLASGEFGNYFNQLAGIAGIGQTATNQTAAYGADAANNASRNALYAGDARASGIIGGANAWGNTAQDLASLYGYSKRGVPAGYGGTGYGGYPFATPGYGDGVNPDPYGNYGGGGMRRV